MLTLINSLHSFQKGFFFFRASSKTKISELEFSLLCLKASFSIWSRRRTHCAVTFICTTDFFHCILMLVGFQSSFRHGSHGVCTFLDGRNVRLNARNVHAVTVSVLSMCTSTITIPKLKPHFKIKTLTTSP